ncbi:uncharacterized protein LOC118857788 [Trichosurus vulpecula]|uniref:uncharacterized protein LOC118857788 n=1 Tax=Trichosurus vulpecula TaxID=9337 RepID=UPI00186B0EF7|nr:uncharacterized protein LOC118857788 [Trichosurus vulpecula]
MFDIEKFASPLEVSQTKFIFTEDGDACAEEGLGNKRGTPAQQTRDACAGEHARTLRRGKFKFRSRFRFRCGVCPCRAFGCRSWWGGEVAKMLRNLLALRQIPQRTINVAPVRQFKNKVAEKQKLFQEDDNIPVHLKGGVGDALLYRVTMVFTVFGTAYALYQLGMASFPKKQD